MKLRPPPPPRAWVRNAFCPTGPGGGIDPSCSPGGGAGGEGHAPPLSDSELSGLSPNYGKVADKKMAAKMKSAVEEYVGDIGAYEDINQTLRSGNDWTTGSMQTPIRQVTRAIDQAGHSLSRDVTLYRAVGEMPEDFKEGGTFQDKGFLSTTHSLEEAKRVASQLGGKVLAMTVPKGTKALAPPKSGDALIGGEVLLQRDTKMSVGKTDDKGITHVRVLNSVHNARRVARKPKRRTTPASKFDPTRTGSVRRAFVKRLRAKWKLIRGQVHKLVLVDDAFGLRHRAELLRAVENAFCPTGPGGGIDPTCSPGGAGTVTVYHGTADKALESIAEHGIIPSGGKGADAHALVGGVNYAVTYAEFKGRNASVFVTADAAQASVFGAKAAQLHGAEPVVLKVEVPAHLLKEDEAGGSAKHFRLEGTIKPEWIKDVMHVDYTRDELVSKGPLKRRAGTVSNQEVKTVYVVLLASVGGTANAGDFAFDSSTEQLAKFQAWLRDRFSVTIAGKSDKELWDAYIADGFEKGAGRAFDDARKGDVPVTPEPNSKEAGWLEGSRDEFLRSAFGRPETVGKVQLLASRTFTDLKNVTDDVATRIGRTLADGLTRGANPRELARELDDDLELGQARSETIARTEIIRAHAEGQLDAFDALGVTEIGVLVEWSTAGDDRVCPECEDMDGKVFTIEDAHGLIPAHPNCRCAFIPANVGERTENRRRTRNVFCPTGPGGGVNPTCSPGGGPMMAPFTGASPVGASPSGPSLPTPAQIHAQSGLQIGHQITRTYKGTTYTVQVMPHGFQVSKGGQPQGVYSSLTAAAQGVRGSNTPVNGWAFFNVAKPAGASAVPASAPPPAPAPTPAPATPTAPTAAPPPAPSPPAPGNPVPVHSSGLPVGATYTKTHNGQDYKLEVRSNGFKVNRPDGTTHTYKSLSAAAAGIKGNNVAVNGWKFFGIDKPGAATPVTAPTPAPSGPKPPAGTSTIPFQKETAWATGDSSGPAGAGTVLNGVPFSSAPPKFWEKTKDEDIKEPKPSRKIERALCVVKEPDGRVWTVEPTGHYGNRRETIPGGTVEHGLTLQQNALKETFEETGLQVRILKHLGDVEDSNTGRNGRVYLAERVGGAPWDAKIENSIRDPKTGLPAAESSTVRLSTPEHANTLLHRTDDLAMMGLAVPLKEGTKSDGNVVKKIVDGIKPASDAYKAGMQRAGKEPGSADLHSIQELRGFNDKPTVVDKQDFDKLVARGDHIELLRGVKDHYSGPSAKDMVEQFKTGDHFPGYGCFGNGTYADSTKGSGNVAGQYAGGGRYSRGHGGEVVRIALPKTAKIIKIEDLDKLVPRAPSNFKPNSGGHSAEDQWRGMQAALLGYDAIHVTGKAANHPGYGKGFYSILNRSILVVQKESAKGHVIK